MGADLIALLALLLTTAAIEPVDGQLRLDYAAFLRAESDFRELREASELNGEEASDYAAWVAGLQRRVFEDCAAVVSANVTFPDDLPCPVIVPPATTSIDNDPQFQHTFEAQTLIENQLASAQQELSDEVRRLHGLSYLRPTDARTLLCC